jgi:hypothetical protein
MTLWHRGSTACAARCPPPPGDVARAVLFIAFVMLLRATVAAAALGALVAAGSLWPTAPKDAELGALQARVEKLEERVAQLEAKQAEKAGRGAEVQAALDGLDTAARRLATGDTHVEALLSGAEAVLQGQAQWDVRAARTALANGDLAIARQYLGQAVWDAQVGQGRD